MNRSLLIASGLLALATSTASAQQQLILSGTFEGDGASPGVFVTASGQRHTLPPQATWGPGMSLPPELLRALPTFRAQVLFEKRGADLVPVRLHTEPP
jgi:hypothetical protein